MAETDDSKSNQTMRVTTRREEEDEDNELLRELLGDNLQLPPFLLVPKAHASPPHQAEHRPVAIVDESAFANKLMSAVYSGPTIFDIESALSASLVRSAGDRSRPVHTSSFRPTTISLPEKGYNSRIENKYTLRMKSCANGMTDDGYKWRKYGQKSIKNSPNPRSYYRCTNPRCNAKKQVERSPEDPDVLVVTYEGLHLHYAYSHFFLARPPPPPQDFPMSNSPKRPRAQVTLPADRSTAATDTEMAVPLAWSRQQPGKVAVKESSPQGSVGDDGEQVASPMQEDAGPSTKGLLEDIVPLLVRNPSTDITGFLNESFSQPSSPISSSSSSCLSWSPMAYFDMGVLSSTM